MPTHLLVWLPYTQTHTHTRRYTKMHATAATKKNDNSEQRVRKNVAHTHARTHARCVQSTSKHHVFLLMHACSVQRAVFVVFVYRLHGCVPCTCPPTRRVCWMRACVRACGHRMELYLPPALRPCAKFITQEIIFSLTHRQHMRGECGARVRRACWPPQRAPHNKETTSVACAHTRYY